MAAAAPILYGPQPNYDALTAGDPQLAATMAQINAQGVTNQAQLTAAQQAALIRYGRIPDTLTSTLSGDLTPAVDDVTRGLADQSTASGFSTVAQLLKAYQNQQAGDTASLAARGLLHSGAYGQHQAEDLSNYNLAGANAQSTLMDYLNGLYSGYQTQQQALRTQATQAANDALQRQIAQIQAGQLGAAANPDDIRTGPYQGNATDVGPNGPATPGYGGGADVYGDPARPSYQLANGTTVAPITYSSIGATPKPITASMVSSPLTTGTVKLPTISTPKVTVAKAAAPVSPYAGQLAKNMKL